MEIRPSESSDNNPQYTTYITTWGPNPVEQVQAMINSGAINSNTMVDLAFASYNWNPNDPNEIPGMSGITSAQLTQVVNLIHQAGGKVSLSIGGSNSAYNYYGSTMYGQPEEVANCINQAVKYYGFDGVDFDVEDQASQVPSDFATNQAEVVNTLRSMNPNVFISLTLPAQAWGAGDYQQQLVNLTIGNINAFVPMEYDLWMAPSNSYVQQVESDISYYINNWGVPPSKIMLGLMPGTDDSNQNLTLDDATQLAQWAKSQGLYGVMTWDADNDAGGIDGNPPFAYSKAIEQAIEASNNLNQAMEIQSVGTGKRSRKAYRIEQAPDPEKAAKRKFGRRKWKKS